METQAGLGILSLLPVILALILAFVTKNAVFSLLVGCGVGVVLGGLDPATGLAALFRTALGNEDFIWVMMLLLKMQLMMRLWGSSSRSI